MLLHEQEIARAYTTLSVVVPVFNEQEVLPEFHRRLGRVLDTLNLRTQVIYVNDGSTDGTLDAIGQLAEHDARVMLVDLSRNFGKEIALTAGLDHADADAVVVIDADLQDPPELIPELVAAWLDGHDVVYAKRTCRDGESAAKKLTAFLFYRLIQKMSRVRIPEDTGDFRLLSRRAVHAVCQMREQHRFMKGLFAWIGFPQKAVPYRRAPRHAGTTKWNYWKLWNFALEGITSFSCVPLKVATYVGLASAFGAFGYGVYTVLRTLVLGNPVPGYPSLLTAVMFLGGLQLLSIGVIGEYLARMFDESKQRPLYFLKDGLPRNAVRKPTLAWDDYAVREHRLGETI
jgi:glycosyltransferase involved in cell wall biosynthesis